MSYHSFRTAVIDGFIDGFAILRPSFPDAGIIHNRSQDLPPVGTSYLQITFADLEGNFQALGKLNTQTALMTVDCFVPLGTDMRELELLAADVRYALLWLVLPDSGRKENLSKRDFGESIKGYEHTRVSVRLIYDIKGDAP
jgi:hypothetical protein